MANFKYWKEYHIDVPSGYSTYNLKANESNVLKVINDNLLGTEIYLSTYTKVDQNFYELKVDKASSSSLVRPQALDTVYLFNPSPNSIRVRLQEIFTDDIAFIFNSTNTTQVSGQLSTDGLRPADLSINGDRTLNVKASLIETKLDSLITLLTTNNTKLDSVITLVTSNNTKIDTTNSKLDQLIAKP